MSMLLALSLSGIFLILSILHLYWGFGGKWAIASTLPSTKSGEPVLKPAAIHCFIAAGGLMLFGVAPLLKVGLLSADLPAWISAYSLWAITTLFFFRAIGDFRYVGFFKKIRDTNFGRLDTFLYAPLSFIISLVALLIQVVSD